MPQFPWQKSFNRSSPKPDNTANSFYLDSRQQHPDLPLSTSGRPNIQRSTSVNDRHGHILDTRRSIAHFHHSPSIGYPDPPPTSYSPQPPSPALFDSADPSQSPAPSGITRSQTVVYRRDNHRNRDLEPVYEAPRGATPLWSPDLQQLPTPSEQYSPYEADPMSNNIPPGKTSSDSGSATGLDRWSQRRLQRLNTEQGFREQRQGGGPGLSGSSSVLSPTPSNELGFAQQQQQGAHHYNTAALSQQQHDSIAAAQPQSLHKQSQPQPSYPSSRSTSNAALAHQTSNNNNHSRSPNNYAAQSHDSHTQQQYSPPSDTQSSHFQSSSRPPPLLQQSRSYTSQPTSASNAIAVEADSLPMPLGNGATGMKSARTAGNNRQSMHNEVVSRETSNLNSQPDARSRQALPTSEDVSEDDVNQLIKDHKELREKYNKVKKYYFEKEDQVKQLQNSLAHQNMSQSRTSLDDSEYTTRFNRLDGLIAQLAFSIRKSWRSLPTWLQSSVNKDAVVTGKQEMTAAGRAFISSWLVEEVFDKYFHPDLEPALSAQLKTVQRNIRRYAIMVQTADEEDILTAKIVNWRLATLEGLQDALRSPQCPTFRAQMTDMLKEHLCAALAVHLQDPPPSDLEGGVHMIVELVISIAIHLPLESRDVVIEYFMPQNAIVPEQMKVESGIPALTTSIADDAADRASMKSATSEIDDAAHEVPSKKRGMLSALTSAGSKTLRGGSSAQKSAGASGSSSSLQRPESSGKDDTPRVRMAAGIGVSVRGRSVLVRAPVFST